MANLIELTLVIRPPEAAKGISERLLAGTYDPSTTKPSDIAASPSDIAAVSQFVVSQGLKIVKTDPESRSITVSGSAADIEKAFGIAGNVLEGSVASLNYKGAVKLPPAISQIVIAVLGLDQTPIARHHGQ